MSTVIRRGVDPQEQALRDNAISQAQNFSNISAIAFVTLAEIGNIDEVTATEHTDIFADWEPNVAYATGNLRTYDNVLYKCVQAHTSQADWTPPATPALWAKAGNPADEWPEWSQPIGAHDAYAAGDKCSHNGKHWISEVNGNVWEPGAVGTEALWLEAT